MNKLHYVGEFHPRKSISIYSRYSCTIQPIYSDFAQLFYRNMSRFKRTTERGKWTPEQMRNAIDAKLNGRMTYREVEERYGIKKSTLNEKILAMQRGLAVDLKPKLGRYCNIFDEEQENELKRYALEMEHNLMPLSKIEFQQLAYDLAKKLNLANTFNEETEKAGGSFYYGFLKRHPELSLRKPNNTNVDRLEGFNKEAVEVFFNKLISLLEEYQFQPFQIFNADETGISCVHKNSKVIALKGKKNVAKITSGEKGENVTVMFCGNAEGDLLPPFFILKNRNNISKFAESLPAASQMYLGSSGWQTTESFVQWLQFFIENVQPEEQKPVLLIVDGHATHKTLDVITLARANHIHILSLPPHTTHKMQPLDRSFMGPFKKAYGKACEKKMRDLKGGKIITNDVSLLVKNALEIMNEQIPKNLMAGFKCTGIEPYNRTIFDKELKVEKARKPEGSNRRVRRALEEAMPLPTRKPAKRTTRSDGCVIVTGVEYMQKKQLNKSAKQKKNLASNSGRKLK